MSACQVSALLTVDGGCIGQDRRETGWGFLREIGNSVWGGFEVSVKPEGNLSSKGEKQIRTQEKP